MPPAAGSAVASRRQRGRADRRRAGQPPPIGRATVLIYRHSVWAFVAFSAAMLVAFWPSYFSRITAQPTFHAHAHGLAMTLWCGMLIAQAWLIRSGRRPLHRAIGAASYVLAPLIVLTTVNFVHFRVRGVEEVGIGGAYLLALVLNALVAFVVLYGLAIRHRRQPAVHARYMLCTVFPLFTPVTDRLINVHAPSILATVPSIDGITMVPVAGFLLADAILIALAIWDRRTPGPARHVFPIALVVLLAYHASVLTFHRWAAWHTFGAWFAGSRLS